MDLTETFRNAVYVLESLRESPLANAAMHILGYGVTLGLGVFISSQKIKRAKDAAIKALSSREVIGSEATITETHYVPTGEINPETEKEFLRQKIRAVHSKLKLSSVFNDLYGQQVLEYFEKALPYCTTEEPVVFQHLHKVIPPEIFEEVFKKISSNWKSKFGSLYGKGTKYSIGALDERQKYEERNAWAFLVYEKGETAKQFRIIVIHENQKDECTLPAPENIQYQVGTEFVTDPNHGQAERIKIHQALCRALAGDKKLHDAFCFSYATGKIVHVPLPKASNVVPMNPKMSPETVGGKTLWGHAL